LQLPNWPWWHAEVVSGKYYTKEQRGHPASAYKERVEMIVNPTQAGASPPVTRGVSPLVVEDEAYRGMWHSRKIKVLMETSNSQNDKPVVYIQLGHSDSTMQYPGFRQLGAQHSLLKWL
jgi:hypothetical protein